jgi:DNA primase
VLDGDAAGQRRTNEILDALLALFEKNQIDLRILILPGGVDPCDFIATHGSDSFRALVAQAVDPLEHKFRAVTNGLDTLTDTHRASQAAEQLLATLAQLRPASGGEVRRLLLRRADAQPHCSPFHLPEENSARLNRSAAKPARPERGQNDDDLTSAANRRLGLVAGTPSELISWPELVLE